METNDRGAILRAGLLALVVVAFWLLGSTFNGLPAPRGLDAPATAFSAARADAMLARLLGPEVPHPVSTAANQAVRDRVRAEFATLGVKTEIYRGVGCNSRPRYGVFGCGTTEDIIADVVPGSGKAVILMAHYDSVPAGPGAADDQSGVASILETVRALKARGLKSRHPVIALITDGEEAGLLGAESFLHNEAFRARVGAVVNVEARGNQGPSALFQTSPGDGRLIDLYAQSVSGYATGSLFAVIYKMLPNDTDLTPFINSGLTSVNFAFLGNLSHYHTPRDRRENLSLSTLQMHGDNLLGMASGLMQADFAKLNGSDDIYLTLFGRLLPRLAADWALPLAGAAFVLLLVAAYLSRGEVLGIGRRLNAVAVPLVVVLGSAAFGWLLHSLAALVSGQSDPSNAHPVFLRLALALGVAVASLLGSRLASARMTALSVWIFVSLMALATAALLPGFSPYFLFPVLVAALLLLAQAALSENWSDMGGSVRLLVPALAALSIWMPLAGMAELVQGLFLHPLFTVPCAIGALTLVPFLAGRPMTHRAWMASVACLALAAVALSVFAGLQPAYSTTTPQHVNINFVDDHARGRAVWAVDAQGSLPASLRAAASFSDRPENAIPIAFQASFVAPAGPVRFATPTASVATEPHGAGRSVTLQLHGSPDANRMYVVVPAEAGLVRLDYEGQSFAPSPMRTIFACLTNDCRDRRVTLVFASRQAVRIILGEQRYGLPPDGVRLLKARPDTAVPIRTGDTTIVFGTMTVP